MSRRVIVLVGATALVVAGAGLALRGAVGRDGSGAPAPAGRSPASGAGTPATAEPEHVLNDTEHGASDRDDEPAAVVWYQQLSILPLDDVTRMIGDGVGSDLADDRRLAAGDVAARFVVADLSGEGREQFPSWWGSGGSTAAPALACCSDVTVLAAGAAGYPAEEPLVLALVVWSATPAAGLAPFDAWEASFVFLRPAPEGGFTPVDPSTVDSWRAPVGLGRPAT